MRNYCSGLVAFMLLGLVLSGCAKKEMVKSDEPIVPAVEAAPDVQVPSPPVTPAAPLKAQLAQQQEIMPASSEQVAVTETSQKSVLEMIYFDFDSSLLRDQGREILVRNAGKILDNIKGSIQIEGHCDERGSAEYNLALGERRARSAMNYLVTLGVPEDRLSIISYGKEKPLDLGHDEDAWAKNRRDQFVSLLE